MSYILHADGISKTYGRGALAVEALKPCDLDIEKGLFYAIIGRSGSGKSTLLHILGGLDRPTSGRLYIDGEDVFALSDSGLARLRRRRIGFVFQAFNLLSEHTVKENILLPVLLDGREPDEGLFSRVTDTLGIAGKLSSFPDELSGGERQRAAVARALVSAPALILADEPTGNLDAKNGDELIALLRSCAAEFGQTIVVVTHDMKIASEADRIIRIADGVVKY